MRCVFFFFKQKTAYEMRISDWSSDVCSSDLYSAHARPYPVQGRPPRWRCPSAPGHNGAKRVTEPLHRTRSSLPGVIHMQRPSWSVPSAAIAGTAACAGLTLICALAHASRQAKQHRKEKSQNKYMRSEERRVGKEGVSTCRTWWAPRHK